MRKEVFRLIARSEVQWYFTAERLREAAEVVLAAIPEEKRKDEWPPDDTTKWERRSPFNSPVGPYLMLLAFALENLIKGIRIKEDPSLVEDKDGKMGLTKAVKSHDLVALGGRHTPSERQEVHVLQLLSHASVAYGRYSLPLHHLRDEGIGPEGPVDANEVARVFEVIYTRWSEELLRDVPGDAD